MDALTIHEAAETTGWSPRMLRYIERVGLIEPERSAPATASTARPSCSGCAPCASCSDEHDVGLSDIAFALRAARRRRSCARPPTAWFEAEAERPDDVPAADWLRWEQDKHERLLQAAADNTSQEIA